MPPELRKRKAAAEPAAAPPAKKKSSVAKAVAKVKEAIAPAKPTKSNGAASSSKTSNKVGDTINLESFGGEIETHDGVKTTLGKLLDESKAGVVLFTYPKASTPGCTKQACLFRDSYSPLTASGFAIYGLSRDSPKSNTSFKEKQKLPYPLLCDPKATLISAIGLNKPPSSAVRGVFVVDKSGKILAAEPGSPAGTVEVVSKIVGGSEAAPVSASTKAEKRKEVEAAVPADDGVNGTVSAKDEDVARADTAAEVADTAEKLDAKETVAPAA